MKNFWGSFFGAMLGNLAVGVISTVVIIAVMVSLFSSTFSGVSSKSEEVLKDKTVLRVSLNYTVEDRPFINPFSGLSFAGFDTDFKLGLNELLPLLKYAAEDERIAGLYLDMDGIPSGMATSEEIRKALTDFKSSGKFVVAYSENYTQKAYYLASTADEVYLHPLGNLEFIGLSAELEFYKRMLDKIGVKAEAIRPTGNKYKSAVEPFINEKMSDANRLQMKRLLGGMWGKLLEAASEKTGWPTDSLQKFADNYQILFPEDAKQFRFVNDIKYEDEVLAELKSKAGLEEDEELNILKLETYFSKVEKKLYKDSDNEIAVIYASGAIKQGSGWENVVGADDFVKALRQAKDNKDVKAIVLRINSPGGDALASDLIWREVVLAREVKPVVVSMGNYAASGGYYIACAADTIVADHNTLTGSIGVFSLLLNTGGLFTDKIGITYDTVTTAKYADFPNMSRPFADSERAIMQKFVDRIYEEFLGKVASGRNMTREQVDTIAQGRVWIGKDALELGLVDVLGGMDTAVAIAARMAGIENYVEISYPEDTNPMNEFFRDLNLNASLEAYMQEKYGKYMEMIERYESIQNMKTVQARMPFYMTIK